MLGARWRRWWNTTNSSPSCCCPAAAPAAGRAWMRGCHAQRLPARQETSSSCARPPGCQPCAQRSCGMNQSCVLVAGVLPRARAPHQVRQLIHHKVQLVGHGASGLPRTHHELQGGLGTVGRRCCAAAARPHYGARSSRARQGFPCCLGKQVTGGSRMPEAAPHPRRGGA